MYSSTLSLTSALDGGRWSTPRPGRFTPVKEPVRIVRETGCGKSRRDWDSNPWPAQPIGSRYTDYATPVHVIVSNIFRNGVFFSTVNVSQITDD
jgi:hypothetical protein